MAQTQPIFVVGPHRSGTSLATQAVACLGYSLGPPEDLLPPDENNPSGYHERKACVAINDRVLSWLGGTWQAPPPRPPGWQAQAPLAWARRAIAAELRMAGERAVLKDPRFCQTLPLWLSQAPQAGVVLVLRHPARVAASLLRREGLPRQLGERLWASSLIDALRDSQGQRRAWWRDDEALHDPAGTLQRLAQALGGVAPPGALTAFAAFCDPAQRRSQSADLGADGDPTARRLWDLLQHEAWPSGPALDALAADLGPLTTEQAARPVRVAVCSIATTSHLPRAKVLMASLQRHEPAWDRYLCLADRPGARQSPDGLDAEVLTHALLGLPEGLSQRYTDFEFCCAIKPWLAAHLLDQGYDQVLYLDADIEVYAPLPELISKAMLTLTPHRLGPCADAQAERTLLRAGAYNTGCFAVARHPHSPEFLAWWKERLTADCRNDQDHGVFVDQRWMDQAPAAFEDVRILRHPGYNVGHWNLDERPLEELAFFHYSGLDLRHPALSRHAPHLQVEAGGTLDRLQQGYRSRLALAGEGLQPAARDAGSWWAAWQRRLPPYRAWQDRPDLQRAFPFPWGRDQRALWAWYAKHGWVEALRARLGRLPGLRALHGRVLARGLRLRQRLRKRPAFEPGVDLVGYLRAENGVGEACRLAALALQEAGLPFKTLDVSAAAPTANSIDDWPDRLATHASHKAALIHVNGDITPKLPRMAGARGLFHGQRHIGVWHWELPVLPKHHRLGLGFVDELWAPSRFIADCLRAAAPAAMPVIHMPHAVHPDPDPALQRADFGLPEGPLLITSFFDAHSVPQRKNPRGALRAFQRAFKPSDRGVFLLLKANQGSVNPGALAELKAIARHWPNIRVWDATLGRRQVQRLIQLSDAVLSLHRSEGFGLVMAEAMAMGRLAIATGWSGNLDFMHPGNSVLLDYALKPLGADYGPYEACQQWAEPDEGAAASALQRLAQDPAWAAGLAAQGQRDIQAQLSPGAIGARMRQRLAELGAL